MNIAKKIVMSLVIAAVVGAIFSWPLPRYLFDGVSFGAGKFLPVRLARDMVTRMRPGDHLQLMYHFWLFRDQLAGKTPLFHDLYEFNSGEPDEHFRTPSTYYFPFSLFYALGSPLQGHAFGWNLACFISVWLGYLFAWLLLNRYGLKDPLSALLSVPVLTIPFLWLNLSGDEDAYPEKVSPFFVGFALRNLLQDPRLPYTPGHYTVDLDYATDAADGIVLGEFSAELSEGVILARWPVVAGQPPRKAFASPHNLPLKFNLHYFHVGGGMTLRTIRLTREP